MFLSNRMFLPIYRNRMFLPFYTFMNCNGTRSRVTTKMCTNCTWSYFWKNVYKLYMILEFFFWIASRISSHATSWISSHLLMLRRFSLAFWFEKSELKTDNDCFLQDQFRFTLISSQSNKIEVLGPAGSCLPFSCLESENYSSLILISFVQVAFESPGFISRKPEGPTLSAAMPHLF